MRYYLSLHCHYSGLLTLASHYNLYQYFQAANRVLNQYGPLDGPKEINLMSGTLETHGGCPVCYGKWRATSGRLQQQSLSPSLRCIGLGLRGAPGCSTLALPPPPSLWSPCLPASERERGEEREGVRGGGRTRDSVEK